MKKDRVRRDHAARTSSWPSESERSITATSPATANHDGARLRRSCVPTCVPLRRRRSRPPPSSVFHLFALRVCPACRPGRRGEAVFDESCVQCHNGDDARAPSLDAMRGRSPQAIVDALTSGSMRYQGLALSGDERRAVAEFITGRRLRGTVSGTTVGAVRRATPPFANPFAGPLWNGWGPTVAEHALPAGGAGGTDRRPGAAAASEVGVRFSRHDLRVGAADGRRRTPVRRQPERHGLLARRGDAAASCGRSPRRAACARRFRSARATAPRGSRGLRGLRRRSARLRLRARRRDRHGCCGRGRSTSIRSCA